MPKKVTEEWAEYPPSRASIDSISELLTKIQQTQKNVHGTSFSSHELLKQVDVLAEAIQGLCGKANTIKTNLDSHYTEVKAYVNQLYQGLKISENLVNDLQKEIPPDRYNLHYSMDRANPLEGVSIDMSLPSSCGVVATRRGLQILGKDIRDDATEEKIAEMLKYSEIGVHQSNIPAVYKHYGFDYRYTTDLVTIDEIERATNLGYPVHIGVRKIRGHETLIENVVMISNEISCDIFDPNGIKRRNVPYSELDKSLTGTYVLPTEQQLSKTRETT